MSPLTSSVVADARDGVAVGFFLLLPDFRQTPTLRIGRPRRFFSMPNGPELSQFGRVPVRMDLEECNGVARERESGFCARL
jgi:hypothetical protein